MVSAENILIAHQIIKARTLNLPKLMIKHLFHEEDRVVLSALNCLKDAPAPGIAPHYQKLYNSTQNKSIQMRILENMRQHPRREFKELLLSILFQESSTELLDKALQAIGTLASRGEVEMLEVLRERLAVGLKEDPVCNSVIEALFQAGDYDHLSSLVVELMPRAAYDPRFKEILLHFRDQQHAPSFQRLFQLYKELKNPVCDEGAYLIIGLLGSSADEETANEDRARIQRLVIHYCKSEDIDHSSFALQILEHVNPRNQEFLFQLIRTLLWGRSSSGRIQRSRRETMKALFPFVDKEQFGGGIGNEILLNLQECQKDLEEQYRLIKDLTSRKDGRRKRTILDFFENLGHQKLLDLFLAYLRADEGSLKLKVALLSLLKQLQKSLPKLQLERLEALYSYLAEDKSVREKTTFAVEFSKIGFHRALDRLFPRLDFLLDKAIDFQVIDLMCTRKLHQVIEVFGKQRSLAPKFYRQALVSGNKEAVMWAMDRIFSMPSSEWKKLFHRLPRIKIHDIDFLMDPFYATKNMHTDKLQCLVDWIASVEPFESGDWAHILTSVLEGSNGELPHDYLERLPLMIAKFSATTAFDYIRKQVQRRGNLCVEPEMNALHEICRIFVKDKKQKFRQKKLQEFIYTLIIDGNADFHPEIAHVLLTLEDEYGKILLLQCLGSEEPDVLYKTIHYCREHKLGSKWKKIFELAFEGSLRVQRAAFLFFQLDYPDFQMSQLQVHMNQFLEGTELGQESLDELAPQERDLLNRILQGVTSGSSQRDYARQKDVQELTVFFIDIAGYTRRSAVSSIDELMTMLEDFDTVIAPIGVAHNGKLVKKIGDCFLYTFENRLDGVLFSLAVNRAMAQYNELRPELERVHTRIGLATGEVYLKDNDVFGDTVNLASRVESRAPIDGILVHRSTLQGIEEFFEVEHWEPIEVKGIEEPVEVSEVLRAKGGVYEAYLSL